MSNRVLAIHDYQHGGVGLIVDCDDLKSLKTALGESWEIVTGNLDNYSAWMKDKPVYDFSEPTGMLANAIFINSMSQQGKRSFAIRLKNGEKREMWARKREEILAKFPDAIFLNNAVDVAKSDIDVEDDFMKRNAGDV